ncbi:MAG TPA: MarR family transcriptional regulator [Terracidiphilus sp.]|jgi:DNA-binding transcriptional regulator GbsR (MarR family)|nr:MarR family transcriptional regulator [Terracidiphilus sp.]
MTLTDATREFILHWGEMGTRWGVNRTVAQVHALLYLSPESLTAEEIADSLSVARSNVSTSLKELQNWNLAQVDSRMGDRRDYFHTSSDVWTLFLTVVEQRVEREIVPTMTKLQRLAIEARAERPAQPVTTARITAMQVFLEEIHGWYTQIKKLPPSSLHALISIGSGVTRFLPKVRRRRLD